MSENKRNYVRRKKYLNDCYQTIAQTLQLIRLSGKLPLSDQQIKIEAMKHAQAIEAACWSPRMKLSSSEYEELTEKKTKELCQVLTQRYARASSPAQKQSEAVSDSSQELTRQNSGSFLGFQQNSLFFLQPYDESMASSTPPNPLPSSLFDTTLIKSPKTVDSPNSSSSELPFMLPSFPTSAPTTSMFSVTAHTHKPPFQTFATIANPFIDQLNEPQSESRLFDDDDIFGVAFDKSDNPFGF